MSDDEATYLWHLIGDIFCGVPLANQDIDPTKFENVGSAGILYQMLMSYIEKPDADLRKAVAEHFLNSFFFSPQRHLWLLSAALNQGSVEPESLLKLLPSSGPGRRDMSPAYSNLYDNILIAKHEQEGNLDYNKSIILDITKALKMILPERPG